MFWHSAVVALLLVMPGVQVPVEPSQPPFELAVRLDGMFGSTPGTLMIDATGIAFSSSDRKTSLCWDYLALKQVRVQTPTKLSLETYKDRGLLYLGADRTYSFHVTGQIPDHVVSFLLARVERPVVSTVMPPLPVSALFQVPVKNARTGRGSEGTLAVYENGLAYIADRQDQGRFWRFRDVYGVLPLDRYRLQVMAYEGGSGETRTFTFELKTDLPPGMYDALWKRVNPPVGSNRY